MTQTKDDDDDMGSMTAMQCGADLDKDFGDFETKCVQERIETGMYDGLVERFCSMGSEALCNSTYNGTFERTQDERGKNYFFTDKSTFAEYQTLLLGEICSPAFGTNISAKGNHWCPVSRVSLAFICD
jgi:hypothetical protein